MSKKKFYIEPRSFGMGGLTDKVNLRVVGTPEAFYLYNKASPTWPWTGWIRGRQRDFYLLQTYTRTHKENEFKEKFTQLYQGFV